MKTRVLSVVLLVVIIFTLTTHVQATPAPSDRPAALVYVRLSSPDDMTRFARTSLPMYARLEGGLLTGTDREGQQALQQAGLTYQVLDNDLGSGSYYLAETRPSRPAPDFGTYGQVLLKTTNGALLKMDPSRADALTLAGAELNRITLTPKPLLSETGTQVFPDQIVPDPIIQGMIDQVSETQVYTYDRQLAGELPVWVDGSEYTIPTRFTYSGTPIQKTTSFVGQHMADLGMDVEYHVWEGLTYPNVIGEITGLNNPEDIYIIGGHIDDVSGVPGADDNASGSVATLIAADIFSQYQWGCTLRFAFWTGEEEGLLGSYEYAYRAYQNGENILGYLNLDMIAWNTLASPRNIFLDYGPSVPGSYQLAQLFADVLDAYQVNLTPVIGSQFYGASDHTYFLNFGYPAILGIEDPGDFNPYYHTSQDTPAHTDPAYFTDFIRASVGTLAHMSGCLIPANEGALDGHVTAASDGLPLEGATVTADDGEGNIYIAFTDVTGNYTMTLPADTYTVTAALDGYVPGVQSAEISFGEVTILDFALETACEPVGGLDFTWLPLEPFSGDLITFTAAASGTQPIDFAWDFGDTLTGTGGIVTHAYVNTDTYTVTLSALNACSTASASHDLTVSQETLEFFLPMLNRQ